MNNREGIEYVLQMEDGRTVTLVQNRESEEQPLPDGTPVLVQVSGQYTRVIADPRAERIGGGDWVDPDTGGGGGGPGERHPPRGNPEPPPPTEPPPPPEKKKGGRIPGAPGPAPEERPSKARGGEPRRRCTPGGAADSARRPGRPRPRQPARTPRHAALPRPTVRPGGAGMTGQTVRPARRVDVSRDAVGAERQYALPLRLIKVLIEAAVHSAISQAGGNQARQNGLSASASACRRVMPISRSR